MSTAVGHSSADSFATGPAGDTDAVEALIHNGGDRLRARMARIELYLERVTSAAGAPLAEHANATIMAGGKRLRPLLVVLAAESVGPEPAVLMVGSDFPPLTRGADSPPGPSSPGKPRSFPGGSSSPGGSGPPDTAAEEEQRLIRAAVAVELVHSATLVHDDVIDRAQLRRGRPTVAAQAGRQAAIATGDLLFSRAFAELARNEDQAQLRALSDASSALAAGELLQREDAYASDVTIERYLRRCELKTAALFEAACRLGALVAAPDAAELADALGAFARRIGLAFQILDDVLDVSGPVERTGKARGTDLLDGTVTLPLILARERDSELVDIDLAGLRTGRQAEELCDRIASTGALAEARERALAVVAEAKAVLPASLPAGRPMLLEQVADAVVARYR